MAKTTSRERRAGWLAMGALLATAAGTALTQADFHPPVYYAQRGALPNARPALADEEDLVLPAPARALGATEHFDHLTLSDKIDGKAELYLACGFRRLATRRFAGGPADDWFELFRYEMASPAAAYAAFSQQRRAGSRDLQLGREAYATENAVFSVQDRYYLELVGSSAEPALGALLCAAARAALAPLPSGGATLDPRSLFPPDGLIADSVIFHPQNGIGYEPLDQVYTARYRLPGGEVTVYLSQRENPAAAARMAQEYRSYLTSAGASTDGVVLSLFDLQETAGSTASLIFGVHEAESPGLARAAHGLLEQGLARSP